MMRLTILGSGTGVPSLGRGSPAYLLETLQSTNLVDIGGGALRQLERTGVSYRNVDAVFVTHAHPDHIGDLIALIHALKATPGFTREAPLSLFGPPGFREFYEQRIASVATPPTHFEIRVREADERFEFSDLRIETTPTVHSDQLHSIAYRFEQDKTIVFSGDADYDGRLIDLASGADILVLDCSFPDQLKWNGHLCASECGLIAAQANVKQLILSHLYPVPEDQDLRLQQARSSFAGEVHQAADFMVLEPSLQA